jgi:hypothetical protein
MDVSDGELLIGDPHAKGTAGYEVSGTSKSLSSRTYPVNVRSDMNPPEPFSMKILWRTQSQSRGTSKVVTDHEVSHP